MWSSPWLRHQSTSSVSACTRIIALVAKAAASLLGDLTGNDRGAASNSKLPRKLERQECMQNMWSENLLLPMDGMSPTKSAVR